MEIDSLIGIIPTKDEEKLIMEYKGDDKLLAKPEKWLKRLSKIKNYKERIKNLKIFNKFNQEIDYIAEVSNQ